LFFFLLSYSGWATILFLVLCCTLSLSISLSTSLCSSLSISLSLSLSSCFSLQFIDQQSDERKLELERNFTPELCFMSIARSDFAKARYYSRLFYERFLVSWYVQQWWISLSLFLGLSCAFFLLFLHFFLRHSLLLPLTHPVRTPGQYTGPLSTRWRTPASCVCSRDYSVLWKWMSSSTLSERRETSPITNSSTTSSRCGPPVFLPNRYDPNFC
jgi:hypothetical protein